MNIVACRKICASALVLGLLFVAPPGEAQMVNGTGSWGHNEYFRRWNTGRFNHHYRAEYEHQPFIPNRQ